jgi:sulfide:quinone oxidoreductase
MAPAKVLVLGGNFAGLGVAQKLHEYAGDRVAITVVDRKPYLLFVPNIPVEVLENRDPAASLEMPLPPALAPDGIAFVEAEVTEIDVEHKTVTMVPTQRPGGETVRLSYDYLVIALGNRLAYDRIEGFGEWGHTLSDTYHANRLRHYLHHEYRGGPIAVGSARFHQGSGGRDVIPTAEAACEGPPVEAALSLGQWLEDRGRGGPRQITLFTPAAVIAEDVGPEVVQRLLAMAQDAGYQYRPRTGDIVRLTADGIEFEQGPSLEAELKIVFPDWVPHPFLQGLPISDDRGFIDTDLTMRNPRYPEVFAAGDAAALAVPKLGWLAHVQGDLAARQIAKDVGAMPREEADRAFQPSVFCMGDMGGNRAFYIHSDAWYGGHQQILKTGRVPFLLKMQYKNLFFRHHGKVSPWSMQMAAMVAEHLPG